MSKKIKEKYNKLEFEIDIPQLLLHSRNILLHGVIDVNMSKRICEDLLGLSQLSNEPIALWINSIGGSVECGFAIIDTILGLTAPVYTFICGTASSMGALISVAGEKRVMTEHSSWMLHDLMTGCYPDGEYFTKLEARIDQDIRPRQNMIKKYLKSRTRLTDEDMKMATNAELHLWANQAKAKGIVHVVTKFRKRKRK